LLDAISASKLRKQGIYWYLIEQLAERLKTGQLRNEAIYTFDPTVLYEPGKNKAKRTADPVRPSATAQQSGIPPPQEKTLL